MIEQLQQAYDEAIAKYADAIGEHKLAPNPDLVNRLDKETQLALRLLLIAKVRQSPDCDLPPIR